MSKEITKLFTKVFKYSYEQRLDRLKAITRAPESFLNNMESALIQAIRKRNEEI